MNASALTVSSLRTVHGIDLKQIIVLQWNTILHMGKFTLLASSLTPFLPPFIPLSYRSGPYRHICSIRIVIFFYLYCFFLSAKINLFIRPSVCVYDRRRWTDITVSSLRTSSCSDLLFVVPESIEPEGDRTRRSLGSLDMV